MKDQLQLQEIAGYLPYGLKAWSIPGDQVIDIVGLLKDDCFLIQHDFYYLPVNLRSINPILTPMSDIILPQHILGLGYRTMSRDLKEPTWTLSQIQYIYKNHFDIHNLIGRGLAISIHDIPTK